MYIRFIFIALLWLLLCYILVTSQPFTPWVAFVLLTSAIVVWMPLYKKYIKNGKNQQ